jgi:GTP cyclohydrolase II
LRRILLLTNHPPKITAIEGFELEVMGNVPLGTPASEEGSEIREQGLVFEQSET